MLAVVFALLGAASNATGTAFQREAASTLKHGGGLHFVLMLVRQPAWTIGVLGVMGAALFQALALLNGPIALVQPLFVLELPFALLIVGRLLHHRIPAEGWYGVGSVVAGLGLLLASAAPKGGGAQAPLSRWVPALLACYALMGAAVLIARTRSSTQVRAAALGSGAAVGNALTAALLKSSTTTFSDHGIVSFFSAWQTYGFALTGIAAVVLLENALQAGPLAASQPALTIGDALVSLVLGVTVFQETLRGGFWLLPELVGIALMSVGVRLLTRAIPVIRTAD